MELVMPEGEQASADLSLLLRAQAKRVMRRLAERSPSSWVVRALASASRSAPRLAESIVLEPSISVLIELGHVPAALGAIAVALAREHLVGEQVRALSPLLHVTCVESNLSASARRTLAVSDGHLWVDGQPHRLGELREAEVSESASVTSAYPTIAGRIRLALVDTNPYALDETHPDKDGNALSLGDRSVDEWLASLRVALALVEAYSPAIAAEMHGMLRLVIPVGASDERHLSASYREYVGAVYVSLHRDPVTMAEALIHEFQHNKLNLLSAHYPILKNGYDFLYRSPVRPDPRPLMGILLAAHAFVPVAEFHQRVLDGSPPNVDLRGVERRLLDVVTRNAEALDVLRSHAEPSPAGAMVLERLDEIHARHRARFGTLQPGITHIA